MATVTTYTLDQFLADTPATTKTNGIPSGLAEIRDHLEKLLHNPALLKKHLGDPPPYTQLTTIGHDVGDIFGAVSVKIPIGSGQ